MPIRFNQEYKSPPEVIERFSTIILDMDGVLGDKPKFNSWIEFTKELVRFFLLSDELAETAAAKHIEWFVEYLKDPTAEKYNRMEYALIDMWGEMKCHTFGATKRALITREEVEAIVERIVQREFIDTKKSIQRLKAKGYNLILVSASFDVFVKTLAEYLEINHYRSNTKMVFKKINGENLLRGFEYNADEEGLKVLQILELLDALLGADHSSEDTLMVDDVLGARLFKHVTLATLETAREPVQNVAWCVMSNLNELIGLLAGETSGDEQSAAA
jgi:phosphoserine phosphatase